MGCHTWFYKKKILEDFDEQFLKEKNLAFANKEISFAKEQYKTNKEEIIFWKKYERFYEKYLNKVEQLTKLELISGYLSSLDISHSEFNGILYEKTEYYNLFRTTDYEAPILYSLEETLKFISDNNLKGETYFCDEKKKIVEREIDFNLIKEFWEKHPDGLISFG